MGIAPDLRGRIVRQLQAGQYPVSIACELLCDWRDVAQVQGELDMVELAQDVAGDSGRPVLDARDADEAEALEGLAAGTAARVEINERAAPASSAARSEAAGRRPVYPAKSGGKSRGRATDDEVQPGGLASPETPDPNRASGQRTSAVDVGTGQDARGRGPRPPLPVESRAKPEEAKAVGDITAAADDAGGRPVGGRSPTATSERTDATSPGGEQPGTPSKTAGADGRSSDRRRGPAAAGATTRPGREPRAEDAGNLPLQRGPASGGRSRSSSESAARSYSGAGGAGAATAARAETPAVPTPQSGPAGGGRPGRSMVSAPPSAASRDAKTPSQRPSVLSGTAGKSGQAGPGAKAAARQRGPVSGLPEDRIRSQPFSQIRGQVTDAEEPAPRRRVRSGLESIYQGRRYADPRTWGRRSAPIVGEAL